MAPPRHLGHLVVSGQPFDETVSFFTDELGFRIDRVSPADNPARAIVSGFGLAVCIDRAVEAAPMTLCIASGVADSVTAPNGVTITYAQEASGGYVLPDLVPELVVSRANAEADWVVGRAGMKYRDLIPSRLGGRYIASHIEVCDGGPVPDLVHHHAIRFQMIFCHRGWVDVVYEDHGQPFRLEAGDCVLQPPHIRHRVLASSAGAQVVEIGCPAEHDTFFDYELALPTSTVDVDRDFGGQRFVRHQSATVPWQPSAYRGFESQPTAIGQATNGLANVQILRAAGASSTPPAKHNAEFWFFFVLDGSTQLTIDGSPLGAPLEVGDSVAIPAGLMWGLGDASPDLSILEIVVP